MVFWQTFSTDLTTTDYGPSPTIAGATNNIEWNTNGYMQSNSPGSSGNDGWLEFPDGSAVDPDLYADFTITYWANPGTYFGHFGNTYSTSSDGLFLANSGNWFARAGDSGSVVGGAYGAGWLFFAAKFNSSGTFRMYSTSTGWDSGSFTPGSLSNTRVITIGNKYYQARSLDDPTYHSMDDVRIFSAYLSDAEILDIRDEGRQ